MRKHGTALVAAATGSIVLAPAWAWAQQPLEPFRYGHGPRMMEWAGGYGMILGPLFMILVLAIAIALAVLLVRWIGGPWHATQPPLQSPPTRAPLDILKERYARGEIDKQEFEERRRVLGD